MNETKSYNPQLISISQNKGSWEWMAKKPVTNEEKLQMSSQDEEESDYTSTEEADFSFDED